MSCAKASGQIMKTGSLPRYANKQAASPMQTKVTAGGLGCVLNVPVVEIIKCGGIALVRLGI